MRRSVRIWLLAVLASLAGLLLIPFALLTTESGSQWLLRQVPGLTVEGFSGALLGEWSATQLKWQDESAQVQLEYPSMALELSCLWQGQLCVQQLSATQLAIDVLAADTQDAGSDAFELIDIALPIHISLAQLSLGKLVLNGEPMAQGIQLQAQWVGNELRLQHASLAYHDTELALQGTLDAVQDWPLDISVQVQSAVPELGEQQLVMNISGTLKQLQLQGELAGVLQGDLSAQLQPLTENIPARFALNLKQLALAGVLPEQLVVQQLALSGQGDMAAGYTWQQSAELLANQLPISLVSDGLLEMQSLKINQLRLSEAESRYAQLTGQLNWQQDLTAQAQVKIQKISWQQLVGLSEVGIELDSAQAELSYQEQSYQAQLHTELQGPAGAFQVNAHMRGDHQQLDIDTLNVIAGPGQIRGQAQLEFTQGVRWHSQLQVEELNPAYWLADLPGTLAGVITTSGQFAEQLSAQAHIELGGQLRGEPARIQANLAGAEQQWQLSELLVQLGDNRLGGHLRLDEQLLGELQLEVPRLTQILPSATGRVHGQVAISGDLTQPMGVLTLKAETLAFQGYRLQQLDLQAELTEQAQAQIQLNTVQMAVGEQLLGDLELQGSGDIHAQRLHAQLTGPVQAQAGVQGEFDAQALHWTGSLHELQVTAESQSWRLAAPMQIEYQHEQLLQLGSHCISSQDASLCAQQQQLLPRLKIDYQLSSLPLASLRPWLPKELQLEAVVNGRIQIQEQPQGLQGTIELDAGQGNMHFVEQEQRHEFAWQLLRLHSSLNPDDVSVRLELEGAKTGQLALAVTLDPRHENKPVTGEFKLEQLELAPLKAFFPEAEQVQGVIQGRGKITGTLLQPSIDGQIELREGQLSGGQLPVSLEQLWLQVQIKNTAAQVTGGWRSGKNGQAHLKGQLSWQNALLLDIGVTGQQLPVLVAPYADLLVAPDLRLSLDERRLLLSGSIAVPRGYITVPELPEQAVRVSADAHVIGREQQQSQLPVSIDVDVSVGQERLHFSGFGLTALVQGQMSITDNLSGRGVLELKEGRYRAYGQRLQLRRARLVFSGPISQPYIDIEAVRVTGDVTAGLRLSGLADQPQTQIFSQPPMSQEQALSWLLLGRPLTGGNADDSNMMGQAALALGMLGTAPIVNRMADAFGIKEFELDTEGSGMSSSVMASGRITDKLVLSYGMGVFQPSSIIALRYELTKRLYLEAASSINSSLDVFYRRSF